MAYRASKAALNMLAVSYAEELEQAEAAAEAGVKVKVLAVHPGKSALVCENECENECECKCERDV